MIGADVTRHRLTGNGGIEHPTNGDAVYVRGVYAKADDAACEHVHDDQNPMTAQQD